MIPVSKTLRREYSSYLQIILRKNVYEPEQLTDHNGLCKIKPKTRWILFEPALSLSSMTVHISLFLNKSIGMYSPTAM